MTYVPPSSGRASTTFGGCAGPIMTSVSQPRGETVARFSAWFRAISKPIAVTENRTASHAQLTHQYGSCGRDADGGAATVPQD